MFIKYLKELIGEAICERIYRYFINVKPILQKYKRLTIDSLGIMFLQNSHKKMYQWMDRLHGWRNYEPEFLKQ